MEREHINYLDPIRFFSTVSVVFMHVAAGPLRGEVSPGWHTLNILTALAFAAVPLFFMMSGYLLLTDEKTADVVTLLKKRLPRLIVPLATWSVVAVVWNLLSTSSFSVGALVNGLITALHSPQAVHFWYMYTLIALYSLSPLLYGGLNNLNQKGHALVLCVCLIISVRSMLVAILPDSMDRFLQIDLLDKLQFFGGHLCTFILGYYLGKTKTKLPRWALAVTVMLLWAVVTVGTWQRTKVTGTFDQTFQSQSAGFEVLLAACLFLLTKQTVSKPSQFLTAMPVIPLSVGIYMMHNILISVLHRFGVVEQGLWGTLGMTVAVFVICYLTVKTAMTVKPLCYLLTGMPYKTACKTCNWVFTFRKKRKELV